MEKTFENSFTYMFKDSNWKYKLLLLSLFSIPASIITYLGKDSAPLKVSDITTQPILVILVVAVALFIALFSAFIFEGYCDKCAQSAINKTETTTTDDLLPTWKGEVWNFTKIGFSYSVAICLVLAAILGILFIAIECYIKKQFAQGLIVTLVSIIAIPAFCLIHFALKSVFCNDFRIGSFFAFKKAYKLIVNDLEQYFKVMLIVIGLSILWSTIITTLKGTPLIVIANSIAQTYIYLVFAYLRGMLFPAPAEIFFAADLTNAT